MILEIYIDTLWSMLRFMSCRWIFMQGELFEILEDDKCLPEEQVQAIAKQLVIWSHDYCIWLNWLFSFPVFGLLLCSTWVFLISIETLFCGIYRWERCTTCTQTVSSIVIWSHKTFSLVLGLWLRLSSQITSLHV